MDESSFATASRRRLGPKISGPAGRAIVASALGAVLGAGAAGAAGVVSARIRRAPADLRSAGAEVVTAIAAERDRFTRDLHDILGHSLTVISLKTDLAFRLLDQDPERARAELADLGGLTREAVADVRRAVEGYRDLTLEGELVRAELALRAAEITAVVPDAAPPVPSDLEALFAWTVREGVTNVLRHSGARRCEIVLTPRSAEVRDDGVGTGGERGPDHGGLLGLRERARAVGAELHATDLAPGWSVSVVARSPRP